MSRDLISKICDRALELNDKHNLLKIEKIALVMDIECTLETVDMDLQRWLDADEVNFLHDVFGIISNLNRQNRVLDNCFLPRFSL